MNRTITLNGIEPAPLSLRHPLGVNLDLKVTMKTQRGTPVNPTFSQLVLLPRSRGGFLPFDMTAYDITNGVASVEIPGSALTDFYGYGIELYLRREAVPPSDPPVPTVLAARGVLVTEGSAYQKSSLAETTLPTVIGPQGPAGPPGPAGMGEPGQRGSIWTTGPGAPVPSGSELEGDMYLDETTGDVYRFGANGWTRGSF